jgi:type IV pilus assembly protein PilV
MRTRAETKTLNTGNKGFTLLEVLIAILILSVGLLGMASLTVGIIRGNKFSIDLSKAATLAQDKMEDIRRTGYTGVTSETKAVLPSPDDEYKREVAVTPDSPATNMKSINVKVYWGGSSKEDHEVEIETILAQ